MKTTNVNKVTLITTEPSDLLIVNAARVSFSKESWYNQDGSLRTDDQKLLNYLASHGHWCYDDKTEILTNRGWVNFVELNDNDLVAQVEGWDEKLFKYSFIKPSEIHRTHYKGHMYLCENENISYCVTPNHKMLYKLPNTEKWLTENSDVIYGIDKVFKRVSYPAIDRITDNLTEDTILGMFTAIFHLNGFTIEDGNYIVNLKDDYSNQLLIQFLDSLKMEYVIEDTLMYIKAIEGFKIANLDNSFNIFGNNLSFIRAYYGVLKNSVYSNGISFKHDSHILVKIYNDISPLVGFATKLVTLYDGTYCAVHQSDEAEVLGHEELIVKYDGVVSCVTVPTGMLYVRRNGKTLVCGNTPFSHVRDAFLFGIMDFSIDNLMGLSNPNLINTMVYSHVRYDGKSKLLVKHSLYGWVNLIKTNRELGYIIFSKNSEEDILVYLSDKYTGSMKAYNMLDDRIFESYIHAKPVDVVNDKLLEIDSDKLDHFIDYTVREEVPISVARQRFKHMVSQTFNEVSRRYVSDSPTIYIPDVWRLLSPNKKQGSFDIQCDNHEEVNQRVIDLLNQVVELYDEMVDHNGKYKVCPEQARFILPQGMITSYYVTGSKSAFKRIIAQRKDEHAQKEIRDYADLLIEVIPE